MPFHTWLPLPPLGGPPAAGGGAGLPEKPEVGGLLPMAGALTSWRPPEKLLGLPPKEGRLSKVGLALKEGLLLKAGLLLKVLKLGLGPKKLLGCGAGLPKLPGCGAGLPKLPNLPPRKELKGA